MTRSEKRSFLEEEVLDWRKQFGKAFLRVVNNKRRARNLPPFSDDIMIYIPSGPNADLFLLTLKVWCLRFHVTPDWMIEKLLFLFKNRRKPDDDPNQLTLGIAAPLLVGTMARNFIEESLKTAFPNDENTKSLSIPVPNEIKIDNLDFSISEVLNEYIDKISKERQRFEKKMKQMTVKKRPYRSSVK